MALLERPLSIQFSTKFFKGINHVEIVVELRRHIELDSINSIQLTEKDCIVSLKNEIAKDRLVSKEISLRDRSVYFLETDNTITNVTVKDAPFEVNDCYIATQMMKYGKVVPGSVKRGYIRGTDIENGSRYLQIINCVPTLPNRTMFGRFEVRIFADNNRTPCVYCKLTSHPSYQCSERPVQFQRTCYNCQEPGHIAKFCKNNSKCSFCKNEGHTRDNCEDFQREKDRKAFGEYANDIFEGRNADRDAETAADKEQEHCETPVKNSKNILLGASNCKRLGMFDKSLVNASISGATFEHIDECIRLAQSDTDENTDKVEHVVICLGTNDVSKHKEDSDEIILCATEAVTKVKSSFPNANIGICSILPRKGNSNSIMKSNETSVSVNNFLRKLCMKDDSLEYIDISFDFQKQGALIKSMYDKNDASGVHVGPDGAQCIIDNIISYIQPGKQTPAITQTPRERKRYRSEATITPTSADRLSKLPKS